MTFEALPLPAAFAAEYISSCDAIAMIAGWRHGEAMGYPRVVGIDTATGQRAVQKRKGTGQAHAQIIAELWVALKFPRYAAYVEIRQGETRAVYRPLPRTYWYRADADKVVATGLLQEAWEGHAAGTSVFLRLADTQAHHAPTSTPQTTPAAEPQPKKKQRREQPERSRVMAVIAEIETSDSLPAGTKRAIRMIVGRFAEMKETPPSDDTIERAIKDHRNKAQQAQRG